jgi:Flp pilus assembly protein TadG
VIARWLRKPRMPRRPCPPCLAARQLAGWAERGQALALTAVLLPLFFSVIGLAIDGGAVFAARRELQNTADAAARAGAMQLDVAAYRQSSGSAVVLDAPRARQAAAAYLSTREGIVGTVEADSRRVVVDVTREVPLGFLRLAGIERARISATAPAEIRYGVERGSGG